MDVSTLLARLYYDPELPTSLGGRERLWKGAREFGVKRKEMDVWLKAQRGYTRLREKSKVKKSYEPTYVNGVNTQWQADLLDVSQYARENGGVRFILTVIDVLSRRAYARPLKNKGGKTVSKELEKILKESQESPQNFQTDKGKEFYNADVRRLLAEDKIHHFSTSGDNKATIVERFNRTLKQRLIAYMLSMRTHRYLEVLPQVVRGYNATPHSAHGLPPKDVDVWNQGEVHQSLYGDLLKEWWDTFRREHPDPDPDNNKKGTKTRPQRRRTRRRKKRESLTPGTAVRLLTLHTNPFARSYYGRWSEEIFRVKKRVLGELGKKERYSVTEWDGSPIKGEFYRDELQPVQPPQVFDIEKVLRRRRNKTNGQTELFVRWKGYGAKYDSWIPQSHILR